MTAPAPAGRRPYAGTQIPHLRGPRASIVLSDPEVFDACCPWRGEWATYARVHPEAV